MKKINRISAILMAVLVFVGLAISAINTFAANKYNINYSGGAQLSTSNVTVDPSLSGLTALYTSGTVSYSNSSKWETVYKGSADNCVAHKMIRAWDNSRIGSSDDAYFVLSNSRYDVKVKINQIVLEGFGSLSKNGDNVAVAAGTALYAGYTGTLSDGLYSDSKCTQPEQGLVRPSPTAGQRIFVDTTITLYKHDTDQVFTSDKLYFGVTDIDAAQSFKFMNSSITMAGNLYAMSNEALNTTGDYNPNNLKNMFVSSGNYIYSQYDTSTGAYMTSPNIHNIYLKTSTTAQAEGLNVIFGFATNAGSSIRYYAQQYTVTYDSDSNGTISGKTSETVVSGNNPTGSSSTPNTGYEFKRWTANKNVTLTDGTTIAAGQPLTSAQVKKVVVNANIKFTAIHETMKLAVTYKSDNNGTITGKTNETVNYNNNPTGSESTPEPGFVFDHWVADRDVVLTNGDTIIAGNPITDEQVAQVVVTEALEFTAIHRDIRLDVTYASDEHGEISGIEDEKVIPGENPTGSETEPEPGFVFDHWIADKDVKLEDGTEIPAGQPIDDEEVAQIIVEQPLELTAIHEDVRLNIVYESDGHGEITGITNELVVPDENPTGSESTPEDGFVFEHWVADKDVTLEDGTEIPAGDPISQEQIPQIVVDEDIVFTAIHKDIRHKVSYESDDNGTITGTTDEVIVPEHNPNGSDSEPEEGFVFDHWVIDKDVTLEDGTVIKAGDPVTPEQVPQIIVTEDLVITAVHKDIRLNVVYESDTHGKITGITDEVVVPGRAPKGSESAPDDRYEFLHWVADKAVILEDGTEIQAGGPISPEQLLQIVIEEDLVFTAIHKVLPVPDAPNTGTFMSGIFADSNIVIPILGLSVIAALVKLIPMIFRKRVKF